MEDLVVYAVEWVEVEFGQCPEGYKLFLFENECVTQTLKDISNGSYQGGYCGPARPTSYIKVPFNCLSQKTQHRLRLHFVTLTDKYWEPPFASARTFIR